MLQSCSHLLLQCILPYVVVNICKGAKHLLQRLNRSTSVRCKSFSLSLFRDCPRAQERQWKGFTQLGFLCGQMQADAVVLNRTCTGLRARNSTAWALFYLPTSAFRG